MATVGPTSSPPARLPLLFFFAAAARGVGRAAHSVVAWRSSSAYSAWPRPMGATSMLEHRNPPKTSDIASRCGGELRGRRLDC